MAGWRGTCRAHNWVCMLYQWLVGVLVMIAVSRWPWWQLHAGCPRPACLFLSGPGTLNRQLLSPVLITPSCPPCCLAMPSKHLHNTSSLLQQCHSQAWMTTSIGEHTIASISNSYHVSFITITKTSYLTSYANVSFNQSSKHIYEFISVPPKISFIWNKFYLNYNIFANQQFSSHCFYSVHTCLDFAWANKPRLGMQDVHDYNLPTTVLQKHAFDLTSEKIRSWKNSCQIRCWFVLIAVCTRVWQR